MGFGGLYTLRRLVDGAVEGFRVTAIDRRDRFVFTPLLYEYLVGELAPDVVAPPFADLVPEGVDLVTAEVRAIDVRENTIEFAGGRTLTYDLLVLSPGSVPAFHGVEGAQTEAVPFYSLADAERLRIVLDTGAWVRSGLPACVRRWRSGGGGAGVRVGGAAERGGVGTGPRAAGRRR